MSIIREYENGVELKETVYYPDETMEGYFTYEDDEINHTSRTTRHNPDGTIKMVVDGDNIAH